MNTPNPATTPPAPAPEQDSSMKTVLLALIANSLIATVKSFVAAISGSAAMVAEAAHSWADAGNGVFLLLAERRASRPPSATHPLGYGRAAYVWALVAGFGLFTAGSVLSIVHGIHALQSPAEAGAPGGLRLAFIVLAAAAALESVSFFQARRQAKAAATRWGMGLGRYILRTSETTVRSVYLEDLAALVGIAIAALALWLSSVTGNPAYDAVGSILVGVVLGVVALVVMVRNAQFLVGEAGSPELQAQVMQHLTSQPGVAAVPFLHVEFVGPSRLFVVAAVDLHGDEREAALTARLRALEASLTARHPQVLRCLLTPQATGAGPAMAKAA